MPPLPQPPAPPLPSDAPPDRPWWSLSPDAAIERLDVDPARGLSTDEAARRRAAIGPNVLREHVSRSAWDVLLSQFKSLIVGLLGVAALVALLFGDTLEAGAILAVLVINTAIGFTTEWRAVRSMEALRQLGHVDARVRRDGTVQSIPAEELVPGDIVLLDGGDVVTADLRLLKASRLQADESALTGESVPVDKAPAAVDPDAPLAERTSMLYKGTSVPRGTATAVVVGTGMDTELGEISELVETAEAGSTPLEDRLAQLGRRLIGVTVVIIVAVTATGVLRGKALVLMIETGLALAVAAIPEGLPIVATIALARGMRRMAKRNALVRRLASVETLGATGVICTDKTGTLTENRMTLTRAAVPGATDALEAAFDEGAWTVDEAPPDTDAAALLERLLDAAVLCTDASRNADGVPSGDAMEVALVRAADARGRSRETVAADQPRVGEEAFDADVKMMATVHEAGGGYRIAIKGAPEAVLDAAEQVAVPDGKRPLDDDTRAAWLRRNEALAADGLRVLAVAERTADAPDAPPYEALTLLGLVGFTDPPREDVRPALDECRAAGIEVVMMTGDQPVTARSVGKAVGLVDELDAEVVHGADMPSFETMDPSTRRRWLDVRLFARVTPRQKLDLIALHQDASRVVAMTGDGVNDAPALKKADIGIAMGQRGTQVAQEAADMVLRDDAFSTIVTAVRQGRIIFRNIRRFVYYLLSCNVGEVVVVGLATLLGTTLPILPLQILFLNLVTDVFPALALGMGEGDATTMRRGPRHIDTPILTRRHWWGIAGYGVVFAGAVLGALLVARYQLGMDPETAVTVSFLTLALAQVWHVFNMRSPAAPVWNNDVTRNPYVWGAVGLCLMLLAAAVYVPVLARVLDVTPLAPVAWGLVLGMSLIPLLVGQIGLTIQGHRRSNPNHAVR